MPNAVALAKVVFATAECGRISIVFGFVISIAYNLNLG